MAGMVGKKIGMTQIINSAGDMWPVTVIQAGPVKITQVVEKSKRGYSAVQVSYGKGELKEFRLEADDKREFKVGDEIKADFFEEGDFVDVQGTTIGKGWQGTIKRHHMRRGPESHGSMQHRRIGSIGASSCPSRVFKGHRMAGQMGNTTRTVQNLLVVKVLKDENVILVKGCTPGHDNAFLNITKSFKRNKIDIQKMLDARDKQGAGAAKKDKKPAPKKK